jgi:hypothetical protein
MNKTLPTESAPTMIIPSGTQIEVDVHGQLSIRTPGNLVIQNSGSYGTIQSQRGSIRIEPNVQVEAVNIECAETCYVQGSLTAWKVRARSIQLEDTARAHIILQETERLEVGREARLVGNFSSEKELFLLFSRFAKQLKSMPFYFDRGEELEQPDPVRSLARGKEETSKPEPPGPVAEPKAEGAAPERGDLAEPLFFALVLLEREGERPGNGPKAKRVVDELTRLLRERDLDTLRHTFKSLFGRLEEPSPDVVRARDLIQDHFKDAVKAGDKA